MHEQQPLFPVAGSAEKNLLRLIDESPEEDSGAAYFIQTFYDALKLCRNTNAFDNETGQSLLHRMVSKIHAGHLLEPLIQRLKNMGSDINGYDVYGDAPLHVAIRFGNVAACNMLIRHGANPNLSIANTSEHPIDLAVDAIRYPDTLESQELAVLVLQTLIKHGSRVPVGSSCLILASGGNDHGMQNDLPKVVASLIKAGATVELAESITGRQAIHYAAMRGHWKTTAELFEFGADPMIADETGFLPFNYAEQFSPLSHELRATIRSAEMQSIIAKGRLIQKHKPTVQPEVKFRTA